MNRFAKMLFFVFFLFLVSMRTQVAFANISRPLADQGPTQVTVFLYLFDLDEIFNESQSFEANIFMEFRWKDPRLAHTSSGGKARNMNEVWHPRIQILNQQKIWPSFPNMVEISPKGEVVYRQRVWGSFSQPLELKDFPFDHQIFNIQLVAVGFGPDDVMLVPDETRGAMAEKLSVPDWDIISWHVEGGTFEPMPGHELAGFTLSFEGERHIGYFIMKVIMPMILIVAMSWVVFWIDPKESGTQISVSITTMLTLIAYRFAVGMNVPRISDLTNLDAFILGSTITRLDGSLQTHNKKLSKTIDTFNNAAENATELIQNGNNLVRDTHSRVSGIDQQLLETLNTLEATSKSLNLLIQQISDQPSTLLFSSPPQAKSIEAEKN